MRIARGEQHTTKTLKIGMLNDLLHEAPRQIFAAMLGKNINVRQIRESRLIGDDGSKPHLLTLAENTKTERISYGAFDNSAWSSKRPIGLGQKTWPFWEPLCSGPRFEQIVASLAPKEPPRRRRM